MKVIVEFSIRFAFDYINYIQYLK